MAGNVHHLKIDYLILNYIGNLDEIRSLFDLPVITDIVIHCPNNHELDPLQGAHQDYDHIIEVWPLWQALTFCEILIIFSTPWP